ncbi:hypothetical protein AGABI2DRAFT_133976 [Agaricus bisporus var. bisporus H97]|uniref:hypothetical protein n=1 Tax=Agaricus bisporus var. bisporus (strain H97 / ATCC MYA-4626 / FGSC 10389) TaxID=936046 RepID=UPI00029F7B34|nr:hypothetical protein AGABI2DRAFT_133976 [Agaricus bisporus var. bisporus H97]EKV50128.1 hypothetical protein AGABI2DRAFT_133976 [Agaricus bisporus var. bisporus H97]
MTEAPAGMRGAEGLNFVVGRLTGAKASAADHPAEGLAAGAVGPVGAAGACDWVLGGASGWTGLGGGGGSEDEGARAGFPTNWMPP